MTFLTSSETFRLIKRLNFRISLSQKAHSHLEYHSVYYTPISCHVASMNPQAQNKCPVIPPLRPHSNTPLVPVPPVLLSLRIPEDTCLTPSPAAEPEAGQGPWRKSWLSIT